MNTIIYTLGHSTHSTQQFIDLLKRYAIDVVCDVRSVPFSRYTPHHNQDIMKQSLVNNGIKYLFLGKELGARPDDKECYKDNKVQFDILAQTPLFQSGLMRLRQGAEKFKIALVCAEKKPSDCHRTFLIANHLETQTIHVHHILEDGSIRRHADLQKQKAKKPLVSMCNDLFS